MSLMLMLFNKFIGAGLNENRFFDGETNALEIVISVTMVEICARY